MYSGSVSLLLMIGGAILLVLLAGVILSIIVFSTKSLVVEIIAWVCGVLWFILDMCIAYSGSFGSENIPNYFLYPIYLIFFLLLQYRSDTAEGNKLKGLYIAKTVFIILTMSTLAAQMMNLLLTNGIVNYEHTAGRLFMPVLSGVISVTVLSWVTFLYLQRINASIAKNDIFKSAIIFTAASCFIADILSHIIFMIQYSKIFSNASGYTYFTTQMLTTQLIYFLVESTLAAGIAAYIYKSKQEAKGDTAI
jgi:hypothetical protein